MIAQKCDSAKEKEVLVMLVTAGFEMALKSGVAFIAGCTVAVLLELPDWFVQKCGMFKLMGCDHTIMTSGDKRPELVGSES